MKYAKYELMPTSDNQKSYYGKATVSIINGWKVLTSYTTEVCAIDPQGNFHRFWNGYSATTTRHINSFIVQNGIDGGGKKWWESLPIERFEWPKVYAGF